MCAKYDARQLSYSTACPSSKVVALSDMFLITGSTAAPATSLYSCSHQPHQLRRRQHSRSIACAAQDPPDPADDAPRVIQRPRRTRLQPFSSGPLSTPTELDDGALFDPMYMSPNPNPVYDEPDANAQESGATQRERVDPGVGRGLLHMLSLCAATYASARLVVAHCVTCVNGTCVLRHPCCQ